MPISIFKRSFSFFPFQAQVFVTSILFLLRSISIFFHFPTFFLSPLHDFFCSTSFFFRVVIIDFYVLSDLSSKINIFICLILKDIHFSNKRIMVFSLMPKKVRKQFSHQCHQDAQSESLLRDKPRLGLVQAVLVLFTIIISRTY